MSTSQSDGKIITLVDEIVLSRCDCLLYNCKKISTIKSQLLFHLTYKAYEHRLSEKDPDRARL